MIQKLYQVLREAIYWILKFSKVVYNHIVFFFSFSIMNRKLKSIEPHWLNLMVREIFYDNLSRGNFVNVPWTSMINFSHPMRIMRYLIMKCLYKDSKCCINATVQHVIFFIIEFFLTFLLNESEL